MRLMVVLCFLLASNGVYAEEPSDLVPMYRFYNKKVNEHGYSFLDREVVDWRKADDVDEHLALGRVCAKELPGTIRMYRGIHNKTKRHYYYTVAPREAKDITVDNDNYPLYVWKNAGDGRIGIYGSTWVDGTDVFFDPDLEMVKKYGSDTKNALGVKRHSLGVAPLFYVYPMDTAVKANSPK